MRIRTVLIAAAASVALTIGAPVAAHADNHEHYPATGWHVRDIETVAAGWQPTAESTIVDATTVDLAKPAGNIGTSIETTDLGLEVQAGDTISVTYQLEDVAQAAAGAVRLFVYYQPDADTLSVGPDQFIVAAPDLLGEDLTFNLDKSGTIGTMGLVYDASNTSTGTVRFTDLTVAGDDGVTTMLFVEPEAPEPCKWDAELVADHPECVEPDDSSGDGAQNDQGNDADTTDANTDTDDSDPTPTPTAVPAGTQLPATGASAGLLAMAGLALLGLGGLAVWLTRQRRARYRA